MLHLNRFLKNLLGRDHSDFWLSFFLFFFEGKHLVPVKIPNLSYILQNC